MTGFKAILAHAVDSATGGLFGALVAYDGEIVDSYLSCREGLTTKEQKAQCAFISAHHGVILKHVRTMLHSFHFGNTETLSFSYGDLRVGMTTLPENYFAVLACRATTPLAEAQNSLSQARSHLRSEMGF